MRLKVSGKLKLHSKNQFLLLLTHLSGPAVFCSKLGGLSDTEHIHPIHLWDKGKRWNQRSAVAAPPLQTRTGTTQHFSCVCSIIQEHQTAGWMLTPATARRGSASSCYSLGSDRPAAAHGRDALQLLARTSAITHWTDNTTRVSLWSRGWSLLSCSSRCWRTPAPQTCPSRICCSRR